MPKTAVSRSRQQIDDGLDTTGNDEDRMVDMRKSAPMRRAGFFAAVGVVTAVLTIGVLVFAHSGGRVDILLTSKQDRFLPTATASVLHSPPQFVSTPPQPASPPAPPTIPATPPAQLPPPRSRHAIQQQPGLPAGPENANSVISPSGTISIVRCDTTAGPITIHVMHAWAPLGAQRFVDMVQSGFFSTQVALFRSVKGFLCQTGVAGDPKVHLQWSRRSKLLDDEQWLDMSDGHRFKRGYLSFAGGGKNSRGTEFFFAYRDLGLGGSPWEVPFGTLIGADSFEAMDHWYTGYGDIPAFGGKAPDQGKMYRLGLNYLKRHFPDIDYITQCSLSSGNPET